MSYAQFKSYVLPAIRVKYNSLQKIKRYASKNFKG